MEADQAREAIISAGGIEPRSIMSIGDGWDHRAFLVDDHADDNADRQWIYRFPRREDSARSLIRELQLLPRVAERVDFAIPEPSVIGSWNGFPFAGYPLVPGRPLTSSDGERSETTQRLVDIVDQLHAFPVDLAADLLGEDASTIAWAERYELLAAQTRSSVAPLLPRAQRVILAQRFETFLEDAADFTPTLVHGDLGPGHIRIDEDSGEPAGLIDFGDAAIGDPAIDYVGFRIAFGSERVSEMAARSTAGDVRGFTSRIDAYWWIGSLHAVLHGLAEDDESIVVDGLSGLRYRLAAVTS